MNISTQAISCTYARDLPISVQIELGIADWEATDDEGRVAFGHSESEAIENLKNCAGYYVSKTIKREMGVI